MVLQPPRHLIKRYRPMNNNETEFPKVATMPIIAETFEKSFFTIENEFMDWEKQWMWKQLKSRSNLTIKSREGLNLVDLEFLKWFLSKIESEMDFLGNAIIQILNSKFNYAKSDRNLEKKSKWEIMRFALLD